MALVALLMSIAGIVSVPAVERLHLIATVLDGLIVELLNRNRPQRARPRTNACAQLS
jgi:diacylglycerol kinase